MWCEPADRPNVLFACSVAFAFDPYSSTHDAYSYRSNPYGSNPYNTYPHGSSRPLNPGPEGRYNDDEYNSRQQISYLPRRLPLTLSPHWYF